MEAVFAQLVLLGDFEVDGISMNMRWDRGVKTGVEVGDIGSLWQERRDGFDDCKGWRVVSEVVRTSMDRPDMSLTKAPDHSIPRSCHKSPRQLPDSCRIHLRAQHDDTRSGYLPSSASPAILHLLPNSPECT
jgi:hypothetical protein